MFASTSPTKRSRSRADSGKVRSPSRREATRTLGSVLRDRAARVTHQARAMIGPPIWTTFATLLTDCAHTAFKNADTRLQSRTSAMIAPARDRHQQSYSELASARCSASSSASTVDALSHSWPPRAADILRTSRLASRSG
jgi:hypothetical protein